MALCGLSGPLATGKSTLISLLESVLPKDSIIIHDMQDKSYKDMCDIVGFHSFKEISKDRDFFLIYYGRIITYYEDMIKEYENYPGLVFFDGTHVDLLIYGMLNLWYHYPTKGLQEEFIHKLLELKDKMNVIYMTVADDDNFKIERLGDRRYKTGFLQCRKTELYYYDIFRDLPYIVTLPSPAVINCDSFILNDLKARGII